MLIRRSDVHTIVFVRHGQSEWNEKNLFTGWYDAKLTELGKEEASSAGEALRRGRFAFDVAFTSLLTRAIDTLRIILKVIGQKDLPVGKSWRLNERHYGALIGLNKSETAAKLGEEKVSEEMTVPLGIALITHECNYLNVKRYFSIVCQIIVYDAIVIS